MPEHLFLHELIFKKPAGTSRGVLHTKPSWIYNYTLANGAEIQTEFPIIPGLSPEYKDHQQYESDLFGFLKEVDPYLLEWAQTDFFEEVSFRNLIAQWRAFPSFIFGLEVLLLGMRAQGNNILFDTPFTRQQASMPINGLVWMDTQMNMREQIQQKIAQGFKVVKLKIGAIAWEEELALIQELRQHFSEQQITVRVDANGAFSTHKAIEILKELKALKVHSIEQPIKAGQLEIMFKLCAESPVSIAFDEELIGSNPEDFEPFLEIGKPAFLVVKPSLHGGYSAAEKWKAWADKHGIGFWTTSSLESNVGLNHLANWVCKMKLEGVQGLGTGSLFSNNSEAKWEVEGERLIPSEV